MNKYTQLIFFSLLIMPIVFGVAQAQNSTNSTNAKDPFEIMLNQAREQERQKIVQTFAERQKQNQAASTQGNPAMNKGQSANPENQTGAPNSNQPNTTNPQGTPSTPATPAAGTPGAPPTATANVPVASVNPTNTPQAPANIYAPPPAAATPPQASANPAQASQPQLPSQQQKPTNMY